MNNTPESPDVLSSSDSCGLWHNDIVVRHLRLEDFDNGFPDVLTVLAPVGLSRDRAVEIFSTFILNPFARIFVAVDGKKVVGCATMFVEKKFIHAGGMAAHIEDVAVDPNYQGHGVGASLVGRCIDDARAMRCYKVILNCDDDVIGFYERLGFRIFGNSMRYDIDVFRQG